MHIYIWEVDVYRLEGCENGLQNMCIWSQKLYTKACISQATKHANILIFKVSGLLIFLILLIDFQADFMFDFDSLKAYFFKLKY